MIIHSKGLSNTIELYDVMKRLRTLMDEYQLHTRRGIIFHSSNMMFNVVASPHMANLLLSDEEDLLSEKNRFIKQHLLEKYNGRPLRSLLRIWKMRKKGRKYGN